MSWTKTAGITEEKYTSERLEDGTWRFTKWGKKGSTWIVIAIL